jgi:hypothetical protein
MAHERWGRIMTTVGIKVDGLQALLKQLRDVGLASETATLEVITDIVTDTHALAVAGIQGGPKTGRVYGNHQASAPGQYPASDTGRLAAGVRMVIPTEATMTGQVGTNVVYGPMLEFGTSKMAARPWLLPSFERAKIGVERELRARLEAKI